MDLVPIRPVTQLVSTFQRCLPPVLYELLRAASRVANGHGIDLYLVGGTVRDLLSGRNIRDLDFSAVGLTETLVHSMARDLGGHVSAWSQFGTAKLYVGGSMVDVAMSRRELYSAPGALPDVSPGSIDDDLARRDFTINAMAVSLLPDSWGVLLDPHKGRHDLEKRLLRTLHARSFIDDATRIMRAVRYSSRLDFRIESVTLAALRRDLGNMAAIKGDRIRHELDRIFDEERAAEALEMARDFGTLQVIDPALVVDDALLATLSALSGAETPDMMLLFLSTLSYGLLRGDASRLTARLNLDSRGTRIVADSMFVKKSADELRSPGLRPRNLHRLLCRLDPVAIRGAVLAVSDPVLTQRLQLYLNDLRHVTTILNGDDLLAMGVPEGPLVGSMLSELLAARMDGLLATREDEEGFVVRRVASGRGLT